MDNQLTTLIKSKKIDAIVLDGPLSQQYAKILQDQYKKEIDPQTGISLETQSLDVMLSKSNWIMNKDKLDKLESEGKSSAIVYCLKATDAGVSDVVDIIDMVSDNSEKTLQNSAIVIDTDQSKEPSAFEATIVELAQESNLAVYRSIHDYMRDKVL